MPRRFAGERTIVREDIGDGDWVEFRAGLAWGDILDMTDDAGMVPGETPRRKVAILALLHSTIAAWGGPSFEGTELTRDAIARLDPATGMQLMTLANKHNGEVMTDLGKAGAGGSASSPAVEPPSPAAST
ncbi:MAG: hypothetical protein M3O91_07470 [Chloroflexota bacterium]|nr:hypothetical protein [Chloroflexota bacterium]